MTRSAEETAILRQASQIRASERKARKQEGAVRAKGVRAAQKEAGPALAARQKQPRVHEPVYLAWIRRAPCVAGMFECGCSGPVEAAHLRMNIAGRPNPGMGRKADDLYTTPLCHFHHQHDQHKGSEGAFWARLGIDPFALCKHLHAAFEDGYEPLTALHLFHFANHNPARNEPGHLETCHD